jgi:hypothetical protein
LDGRRKEERWTIMYIFFNEKIYRKKEGWKKDFAKLQERRKEGRWKILQNYRKEGRKEDGQ